MKVIVFAAVVGLSSASNILPRAPTAPKDLCCFTLTASAEGLGSAIVEEDTIGQNRIYSTYPDGYYCINPAEPGKLYDQGGRTCIISKITQQFQCTQGLTTEVEFTVNTDGDFQADGSDRFLACLAGGNGNNADGSYLIYSNTRPVGYADKCLEINLSTTGNKCAAPAPVEPTYGNTTTTVVAEPTYEKPTIPIYGPETTTTAVTPPKYEQPTIPIYGPETTTTIVAPPKYENSVPVYKPETTTVYAPEQPVTSIPIYGPETTTTVIAPPKYENSVPVYKPETTTVYAPEKPVTSIPIYGPETTTTVIAPPKYENSMPVYKPETTTVYAPEQPVTSIPIYGPETTTTVIAPPKYESSVPIYKPEEPKTTTVYAPEQPVTSIPIYGPGTFITSTTTTINPSAPSATPSDALLCPALTLIDGYYVAPALIIPVSAEAPDAAYGTQFVAQITQGNSTLFSFDIPADWEGSTCSLIFTFPTQENTAFPGAWKYAGRDPKVEFNKLNGTINHDVTYASKPAVEKSYGQTAIVPGGEYRIDTRSCLAGSRCTFEVKACDETAIEYFQATGPKAIGLWITRC